MCVPFDLLSLCVVHFDLQKLSKGLWRGKKKIVCTFLTSSCHFSLTQKVLFHLFAFNIDNKSLLFSKCWYSFNKFKNRLHHLQTLRSLWTSLPSKLLLQLYSLARLLPSWPLTGLVLLADFRFERQEAHYAAAVQEPHITQAVGPWTSDPWVVTRPASICLPCRRFLLHTIVVCQLSKTLKQNCWGQKGIYKKKLRHRWSHLLINGQIIWRSLIAVKANGVISAALIAIECITTLRATHVQKAFSQFNFLDKDLLVSL